VRGEAQDQLPPIRGRLSYRVYDGAELVEEYAEPNMIVAGAQIAIAKLLAGEPGLGVSHVGFGSGGAAPAFGDHELTAPVLVPVQRWEYPAPGRVRFHWELGSAVGDGLQVREFGLFAGGVLVARKVRPAPINKTARVAIFGAWVLYF
jgi:hypothetical protein